MRYACLCALACIADFVLGSLGLVSDHIRHVCICRKYECVYGFFIEPYICAEYYIYIKYIILCILL